MHFDKTVEKVEKVAVKMTVTTTKQAGEIMFKKEERNKPSCCNKDVTTTQADLES